MNNYVYSIEDTSENPQTLYVNLTNRCTNNCVFCIRATVGEIKGKNMWLEDDEVTVEKVLEQFKNFNKPEEVVFCGFGEPLIKFDVLKELSKILKEKYGVKIRVNTNGQANIFLRKNILGELKGLVDEFSISLNAATDKQYQEITNTKIPNAYEAVKDFIKQSVENGFETTATVVGGHPEYTLNLDECKKIAESLGAKFKVRTWLKKGY